MNSRSAGELDVPPGVAIVTRMPPRFARRSCARSCEKRGVIPRSTDSPRERRPTAVPIARKSRTIALNCVPLALPPGYGFVTSTRAILRSVLRLRPARLLGTTMRSGLSFAIRSMLGSGAQPTSVIPPGSPTATYWRKPFRSAAPTGLTPSATRFSSASYSSATTRLAAACDGAAKRERPDHGEQERR